jgi:hypothetical protein
MVPECLVTHFPNQTERLSQAIAAQKGNLVLKKILTQSQHQPIPPFQPIQPIQMHKCGGWWWLTVNLVFCFGPNLFLLDLHIGILQKFIHGTNNI